MTECNTKTVLVTGGAGYIGSHACKALAISGYRPICYDNLSRGHEWAVKWGPLEIGDIADLEKVRAALRQYRPAAVMHFAGYAYAGESVQCPELYHRNNLVASSCLLEAMRAENLRHIVFSSSCAVYGDSQQQPITETAPHQPVSPYGFSKLVIERMLADYARAFDFRAVSLRYFNASGADPEGEIGEAHDPEPHLVPIVLETALGKRKFVEIYGNDYPTSDGTCVRDFVHVTDLAQAHVLALDRLLQQGLTGAFNLGTGRGHSVMEVIETARRVTQRNIPVEICTRREGDPACAFADASLAHRHLGWRPRYPELAQILDSAWRWAQLNESKPSK